MITAEQKQMSSAAEDLAFVREIAEEGRMQPLQGGKYLVMWGLISSIGLAFTGAIVGGALPLPAYSIMIVWLSLSTAGGVTTGHWGRQGAKTPESKSIGNKVEAMVWCVGGLFLFLFSVMLFTMPLYVGDRFEAAGIEYGVLFGLMSPLAFGVYGIALTATAVAGRAPWLWPYIGLSFFFAAITLGLIWDLKQFLAAIIGIVFVIVVPGFIMIDKNRKAQGQG